MQALKWNVSKADAGLIAGIVNRAAILYATLRVPCNRMDLHMDLTAAHGNGCPLKLAELLRAPDSDFAHDIGGIVQHLDRETGELRDCFLPRYAA